MSANKIDFDKIASAQKKKIVISSRRSSQSTAIKKQAKLQNSIKHPQNQAESTQKEFNKLKSTTNSSDSLTFQTQYEKLSEITQRCYHYYQKYHNDQCRDLEKINSNFNFIKKNMEDTFTSLSECIDMKKKQLTLYIQNRRKDLLQERIKNEQELSSNLEKIAETRKCFEGKFQLTRIQKYEISEGLSDLANILNIFYEKIERIENYTIAQALDDTVSFLTNAIEQDIKNFFQQAFILKQSPNISFNNDNLFEHKKDVLFETDQAWQTSKSNSYFKYTRQVIFSSYQYIQTMKQMYPPYFSQQN